MISQVADSTLQHADRLDAMVVCHADLQVVLDRGQTGATSSDLLFQLRLGFLQLVDSSILVQVQEETNLQEKALAR